MLVYDVNDKATFARLGGWVDLLSQKVSPDTRLMVIGNKTDLADQRQVSTQEGADFACELNVFFWETSAKTNADGNVDKAFDELVISCAEQKMQSLIPNGLELQLRGSVVELDRRTTPGERRKCCK